VGGPRYAPEVSFTFSGEIIEWRGPAPFYFVAIPEDIADAIGALAPTLTYGWGAIPATIRVGAIKATTSLFPKNGGYLVPLKAQVRAASNLRVGEIVAITVELGR